VEFERRNGNTERRACQSKQKPQRTISLYGQLDRRFTLTATERLMTRLAHLHRIDTVQKSQLCFAVGAVALMTADARRGVLVQSLPTRQEDVKVIVEVAPLYDVLMAFQAIRIVDRSGIHRRLPGMT
jgi:hypothetical protein